MDQSREEPLYYRMSAKPNSGHESKMCIKPQSKRKAKSDAIVPGIDPTQFVEKSAQTTVNVKEINLSERPGGEVIC